MATDAEIQTEAKRQETFAVRQLRRIEAALEKAMGAKSVSIDGVMVTYDDLLKQHQYFKAEVAREMGARPFAATIKLSGL